MKQCMIVELFYEFIVPPSQETFGELRTKELLGFYRSHIPQLAISTYTIEAKEAEFYVSSLVAVVERSEVEE